MYQTNQWYEHKPEGVIENDYVKLLWDFNIQTSTYIQGRRPDVVEVDRDKETCNIIDIAVPGDAGIVEKEKEKVEKYQDLRREVAQLWNVKAKVVPVVVGALGAVTPNLSKHQAPVVRRLDNAIHWINHYPVDSVVCFVNTYPLDSHLSSG